MERVNRILKKEKFRQYIDTVEIIERERIYCRHGLEHCINVARITMLLAYEENVELDKELVYAAAVLHDIGRSSPNAEHHKKSAELAEPILKVCGFSLAEREKIEDVIENHGNSGVAEEKSFRGLFYRADKLSRSCYGCKAAAFCYWDDDKKNLSLRI